MSDSNDHDSIETTAHASPDAHRGTTAGNAAALPTALPAPRRGRWLWLVPLAALLFVLWAGWQAWRSRGHSVTVTFQQGHGILAGDAVKHRGIAVGEVREVALGPDAGSVLLTLALRNDAAGLAREGSRFWLVRPEIGLQRVAGLDTIVGARYVEVAPGSGSPERRFVGLEAPPIVLERSPGDLSVLVECLRRGSLSPGAPVTYRQVQVGVVESVALAADAGSVEVLVHIDAEFAPLLRVNSVFWDSGGIEVGVGLKGLTAAIESPAALLRGGISFATPTDAGSAAANGDRFRMADKFDDAWLRWKPSVGEIRKR
jgi:paraquat-inducible protein B